MGAHPLNPARGSGLGSTISSPSGFGWSLAAKRFVVHFEQAKISPSTIFYMLIDQIVDKQNHRLVKSLAGLTYRY